MTLIISVTSTRNAHHIHRGDPGELKSGVIIRYAEKHGLRIQTIIAP